MSLYVQTVFCLAIWMEKVQEIMKELAGRIKIINAINKKTTIYETECALRFKKM